MSKVEKGLSATMEKAGLVQINIWKVNDDERDGKADFFPIVQRQIHKVMFEEQRL